MCRSQRVRSAGDGLGNSAFQTIDLGLELSAFGLPGGLGFLDLLIRGLLQPGDFRRIETGRYSGIGPLTGCSGLRIHERDFESINLGIQATLLHAPTLGCRFKLSLDFFFLPLGLS